MKRTRLPIYLVIASLTLLSLIVPPLSAVMAATPTAANLAASPARSQAVAAPDAPTALTCTTLQPGPSAGKDAYIKQDKQDERRGGDGELRVKTENGKLNRALLQFDVASAVPAGSALSSATLSLYVKGANGGSTSIKAHGLTATWTEGEVTWKARDKAANLLWTTLGADYNPVAVATTAVDNTSNVWRSWDITNLVSGWISNPADNKGVILEAAVTSPAAEKKFKSSDDGTASQRPKLEICFSGGVTLVPNNSGQGVAGLSRVYGHSLNMSVTSVVLLGTSSTQGWTARVYQDTNSNGVKDAGEPQITQTPQLAAGSNYAILVEVDVPAGAQAGATDVTTVTATVQSNGGVAQATDTTTVGSLVTLAPNYSKNAVAGTVRFYGHTLINNGDTAQCFNVSATSSLGWSVQLWEDLNANSVHETSNPNEPPLSNPICLDPGENYQFVAELAVPGNAPAGVTDKLEIKAVSVSDPSRLGSVIDSTTVFVNDPPIIDGKYDEIYSTSPDAQEVCYLSNGTLFGKLASFYQSSGNSVYFVLAIDKDFVDNTYGSNAIGWPSGHSFGNLTGSDHAQFQGLDANGALVLDLKLDYLTSTNVAPVPPSGYASLGVTGGEGQVNTGNEADITAWGTSLDYNLNDTGYCAGGSCNSLGTDLEVNSPATDSLYTPNPTYPDWIFDVIYEVQVNKSAFGAAGFGAMDVPYIHASPSKLGTNTIYAEPAPCPAQIGDTVWHDVNRNGTQDAGEPGLANVQVKLYRDNGDGVVDPATDTLVGTKTTSASGKYLFQDLLPDDYFVTVNESTVPSGWQITTFNNPTLMINLGEGEKYLEADFGYAPPFPDLRVTKTQLTPDPIYVGQALSYKITVTNVGTTVITVLPLQDFYDPTVLTYTGSTPASVNNVNDGVIDWSDLTVSFGSDLAPGQSFEVTVNFIAASSTTALAAAADVTALADGSAAEKRQDAGITAGTAKIGDRVYYDVNANGLPDGGTEPGIGGVTLILHQGTCAAPGSLWGTTITGVNGSYLFDLLPAGNYCVQVDEGTLPGGYGLTTGNEPQTVALATGQSYLTADFGYRAVCEVGTPNVGAVRGAVDTQGTTLLYLQDYVCTEIGEQQGAIGDFVWFDVNGDGIQDVDEPGIPNVTIELWEDTDGTGGLSGGDTLVADTVTDADGGYLFPDLIPADYFVKVTDANNQLTGLQLTVGPQSQSNPTPLIALGTGEVYKDADFGYRHINQGVGYLGDTVWYDANGDGFQQPGEPGIAGVTVCTTPQNGNIPPACDITDDNGHYLIPVVAGSYIVGPQNTPAGLTPTTPLLVGPVNISAGEYYLDADFGFNEDQTNVLGGIGNLVFRDVDKDGVFNNSDTALAGVSVDLIKDKNSNSLCDDGEPIIATVTSGNALGGANGPNGNYLFTGVPAGRYLVYVSDTNAVLTDFVKSPLGIAGLDNNNQVDCYPILLGAGATNYTADFGYYPLDGDEIGVIGNQVWIESDGNGLFDPADQDFGQPGVTVDLYDNGQYVATTTTGASGDYSFVSLPAGQYTVEVSDNLDVLNGYVVTTLGPNQGSDNNNQQQPYGVNLPVGGYNLTADFGYTQPGAIGDFVWYDSNGDGIEDIGEPGIDNVTVELWRDANGNNVLDGNDEFMAELVTDADGGYLFIGLLPGTYFVDVTDAYGKLTGLTHIVTNQSQPDPTGPIALEANEIHKDADFGYRRTPVQGNAIIGDTVWYDANGDGFQQPGEPGIANVTVAVYDGNNIQIGVDTTDSNGHYLIEVPAGSGYIVQPSGGVPGGLTPTTVIPATLPPLAAGDQYLNADFGYNEGVTNVLGEIGNLVFWDKNATPNGVFDAGDVVLPGVSVDLIRDTNQNGSWNDGEPIIATVTSWSSLGGANLSNGTYLFTGVPAGRYLVHVSDTNGVLFDFLKSPLGAVGVNNNNQADPYAINLAAGGQNLTADFGYYQADRPDVGVIGNQVWVENVENGLFDPLEGDAGQAGVTVDLFKNGALYARTTTGASGDYAFLNLPGGDYEVKVSDVFQVVFDLAQTVIGQNPGQDNNNQSNIDEDPNSVPYDVGLAEAGYNLTADFGYFGEPTGQGEGFIGDFVWWDVNSNGLQDVGEPGIPDVTMNLYVVSTNTLLASSTTDANGLYSFPNLDGSVYRVQIDASEFLAGGELNGWTASPPNVGSPGSDTINSKGNVVTHDASLTLLPEQGNTTIDFGFYITGADYTISKVLNTAEPVRVSGDISFTITIHNTGDEYLGKVALVDLYDVNYLTYVNATPASDNNTDDGQINWTDLAVSFGQELAPGASWSVVVNFIGKADTTELLPDGKTPNLGRVTEALVDPDGPTGPLPPLQPLPPKEATARVEIVMPTGLGVYGLTAQTQDDGSVVVAWKTANEANMLGFDVLRSETSDESYSTINAELLAAEQSGSSGGGAYSFTDETAAGASYFYKLQVRGLNGLVEQLGPVVATVIHRFFAPLVLSR